MSTVEAAAGKAQAMVRDSVKTVIAASMVGTAIEFYDFYEVGGALFCRAHCHLQEEMASTPLCCK